MFDIEAFVADCNAALAEPGAMLAIKELLDRAVAEPDAMAAALSPEPGVAIVHRAADLTIASVVVPPGLPPTLPHDHRMWALVGIYGGQEDNQFYRRADQGLAESGGRSLLASDTLLMGDDTIHAICNPLEHSTLAALHVYGGDLVGAERSMWTSPDFDEQPYDDRKVIGRGGFRDAGPS